MFGFKWKKRAHVKPLGYTGKDHICGGLRTKISKLGAFATTFNHD